MSKAERFADAIIERRELKGHNAFGAEVPDPTPMAPPVGYVKQPSITERIREMVRSEHLRRAAEEAGAETFEEADDFDVEDDLEPASGYENDDIFEPEQEVAPAAPPVQSPADVSPAPPADEISTGVPSPTGEGKGQGGLSAAGKVPPPSGGKPLPAAPKRS